MQILASLVLIASVLTIIAAQIWLILIIMRGSPVAALLCLVVPFLVLFFLKDHWAEAKRPVLAWASGVVGLIVGAILQANVGA